MSRRNSGASSGPQVGGGGARSGGLWPGRWPTPATDPLSRGSRASSYQGRFLILAAAGCCCSCCAEVSMAG